MIYPSMLELVGNTPVIEISKFFGFPGVHVYMKMETFNPGGSHKIRAAMNMILDAEKQGILSPNEWQTILEPTGGNTGLGIAIVAACRGYKVKLVIPDNYSPDKQKKLKLFGVEIVLSDSNRGGNSHGELAMEIQLENYDYVMLNQGQNPANPDIHRQTTAQEILRDFRDVSIDYFVGGIGTGGHITGIGEVLKQEYPKAQIVGVQPRGCDLLANKFVLHQIQGLAVGIIPKVLNLEIIDRMIDVTYEESLAMMLAATRQEALLVGLSSGANLAAVSKIVEELRGKQLDRPIHILTMAYDSVFDYLNLLE
ncbi:PLP-dependent cysteine synthase family protein [Chamaesiphon minutus]|uniref:Cysteine synthase n=1 Tax=Chamaesiphon minutus (strain ATCC 27169 / PCC 6605) TaxID=1173020 RepID=K9UD32_CHAP6|nr:cysteine synthase family protein [Chamaesiphon minutus]AFY92563.1 cysteine synthase [Chamaesiphon minutus PCC 6605]